ncbi:MAG: DUF493 domain-containing protein [Chromatiales bacterium]|jgi:putative lipoic acid-binding regulatory protein|nr:DUF493 domain-containing protein [Chromatiales bacterium]MDX9767983.1 DUF493 domain-containing protein [Ectothiorhodospiraceae bacterium]
MTAPDGELFQFPTAFPLKVMGAAVPELRPRVLEIVARHAPGVRDEDVSLRVSSGGRYYALSVTIQAESRAQLDALYRELTACELVTMAL